MNHEEWESICDGCGLCCMHKFEDEDTGEILYTNIACKLFDGETCRCTDYENRLTRIPECMNIRTMDAEQYKWLPPTCGYRLLHEGKELFEWHPLVSGDANSVHEAGISLQGCCASEEEVPEEDWPDHIIPPEDMPTR